jgi:hypothetical protein
VSSFVGGVAFGLLATGQELYGLQRGRVWHLRSAAGDVIVWVAETNRLWELEHLGLVMATRGLQHQVGPLLAPVSLEETVNEKLARRERTPGHRCCHPSRPQRNANIVKDEGERKPRRMGARGARTSPSTSRSTPRLQCNE